MAPLLAPDPPVALPQPVLQALLQALADAVPDAVFAKDLQGRYLLLNAAAIRALGREPSTILGHDDRALFPAEVAETLMANDLATLGLGRTGQYEETVCEGGRIITHLVTKSPFRDHLGAVVGLVCTAKDITGPSGVPQSDTERLTGILEMQQAVANAALTPSEVMHRITERTLELLGGDGSAVFLAEEDRLICRAASGSVAAATGESVGLTTSLVGRAYMDGAALRCRDTELDPRVDATLYQRLGIRSGIIVPLRAGLRTIGVLTVVHKQPDQFSEPMFQALLLVGGVLSAALGRAEVFERNRKLLVERTATLQALSAHEERFRSAVHAAGLGVWDWDIATGVIAWLGHHAEIFGLAPGSFDGRYETFLATVHPEDRTGVKLAIDEALRDGVEYSHLHRVVWPDGSIRWVLGRGEFHYDGEGKATRMVGAVMDVTERRKLESQLLQAQKIEAIGQLAAGIAHEINTPIQYVGDNLRFLEQAFHGMQEVLVAAHAADATTGSALSEIWSRVDGDYLTAQIPLAASQALQGAERVADIVRAMKEFSHPGQAAMAPVDLNRAISNTVEVSRSEWRYFADLEVVLDPSLPPITCLQGEIQQVILNLVVNAAHAIADAERESKGRITITTRMAGPMVEILVGDTGTGIPLAVQPKVFDPFFTTKEVGRGTGQGLSLARDTVVNRHHGTLTFTTEAGRGTTFIVRLPVQPRASA